jgi:hypothetical protein
MKDNTYKPPRKTRKKTPTLTNIRVRNSSQTSRKIGKRGK